MSDVSGFFSWRPEDGRLYMQSALQLKITKNHGKFENSIFDTSSLLRKTVNKQINVGTGSDYQINRSIIPFHFIIINVV